MKHPARPLQKQQGITLIELMVTVSVLAVLAAVAAPSFTPLMERWRVRSAAEDLQASIYFARSEAIKRGGGITIAPIDDDWSNGWEVVIPAPTSTPDPDPDPDPTPDAEQLQTGNVPAGLSISEGSATPSLSLDRWGGISPAANFLLAPAGKDKEDPSAVRLCVNSSGRILRVSGSSDCP